MSVKRLERFFEVKSIVDMRDTSMPIHGYICLEHKTDLLKDSKDKPYVVCEVGYYENECVNCTEIKKALKMLNLSSNQLNEWLEYKFNQYLLETEYHG